MRKLSEKTRSFIEIFLKGGFQFLEYSLMFDLSAYIADFVDSEESINRVLEYIYEKEDEIQEAFKKELKKIVLDDYNVVEAFFSILYDYISDVL